MSPGYYGQHIEAAERGGMPAVAATEFFEQRIRDNPNNLERILSMDPEEFCSVMRRWRDQFSQPNPVGDLTEEQLRSIDCPVLAFEGNTPDDVHHKSAAENVKRLVPHAELRPSAWTHEEWAVIGAARQHLPRHRRHQPLPHEVHFLRRGTAGVHRQGRSSAAFSRGLTASCINQNGETEWELSDFTLAMTASPTLRPSTWTRRLIGRAPRTSPPSASVRPRPGASPTGIRHHAARFVIILAGQLEIGLGDGSKHVFGPGDARLVEDTTGQGHTTATHGGQACVTCTIPLANQ